MRRWLKIAFTLCLFLMVLSGTVGLLIFKASQRVPDFYENALLQHSTDAVEAGQNFERGLRALTHDLQTQSEWQAIFTADQINGWLSADLPRQYPGVLPRSVRDPRINLEDGQARLACRVNSKRISTVVSLKLEVSLTDTPNELAIRIQGANAGVVPVPIDRFLHKVTRSARRAKLDIRWLPDTETPTAIVKIPENHKDLRQGVLIESLELRPNELFLAGKSDHHVDVRLDASKDDSPSLAVR